MPWIASTQCAPSQWWAYPGAEITGEVFIWVSPQFKTTDGERWDHAAHGLMEDKRNGQRRS